MQARNPLFYKFQRKGGEIGTMVEETVQEGKFEADVTRPGEKEERYEYTDRKLEIKGNGCIVITRKDNGTVTILPPGSTVVVRNRPS